MMKTLAYPYPITNWDIYNFSDCFGSLYMFLEKMSADKVDYYCRKQEKGDCYGCSHGLCRETGFSPARIHEVLYHTFETLSGTNSAIAACGMESRIRQTIRDTDDTIDFVFRYTGYAYGRYTDGCADKIATSIDAGIPVLARLTDNHFRILTGYGDGSFTALERTGGRLLTEDELSSVYVVTGRTDRTYLLVDALKRIRRVMECNREERVWDEYIESFGYWGELEHESLDEIRNRFLQLRNTLTWWCHSFAEAFRHRILVELKDERLSKAMNAIDAAYDDSHTAGWQGHALYSGRDWTKRLGDSEEWGYCELGADVARRLKRDDDLVCDAVSEMIAIIESGNR